MQTGYRAKPFNVVRSVACVTDGPFSVASGGVGGRMKWVLALSRPKASVVTGSDPVGAAHCPPHNLAISQLGSDGPA